MTKLKTTTLAAALLSMGLGLGSTTVMASHGDDDNSDDFDVVINDDMPRRAPGSTSGSGDTVEANCPTDPSGNAWQDATATVKIEQEGSGSVAKFKVRGAVPDTVFTVWLRIQGGAGWNRDVNGNQGSPLTGGGATPLAPGSALDGLNHYSPWVDPAGSADPTNGFTTDKNGNANWSIALDFPVVGGSYPFYKTATSRPGWEGVPNVGYAIPSPDISPGTPFLLRMISHCTDQVGHGLSPATREAWFQYP